MKVTITSLLLVITCVLFQSSVQAQQRTDTALQKDCPHAWKITPQDPKLAEKSDAWTSKDSDQAGVISLSYCWVFQPGLTTVKRLAKDKLMQLPPSAGVFRPFEEMSGEKIRVDALPLGFSVYKDLAFEIETKAVIDSSTITIRLPSIRNEQEFGNLCLLYLDEDREVPGLLTWHQYPGCSGEQKTDFSTRTLTADFQFTDIFHRATGMARVIVASFDKSEYDKSPGVDVGIRSVVGPPYVKFGEPFSFSVTVVNWSATGQKATNVVLFCVISDAEFVSVNSTQGRCRKSVNSDPEIVCELGSIESTKAAVVTITVRGNDSSMPIAVWGESVFMSMNTVRSKERDYTPENNSYESRGTIIRKVNP
jgi:Domain of unknown function DUF11